VSSEPLLTNRGRVAGEDVLARSRALHLRGVEEFNSGAPARSLVTLRRALRLLDGPAGPADHDRDVLTGRIWISIALCEAEKHSIDRGLAALAEAAVFARRADDPALDVLLHCQRGTIEMRRRRLTDAIAEFNAAMLLLEHASPRDQCVILANRGTAYLFLGDLPRARSDLVRAAERARVIGDAVREFKARHNLGYVAFLEGQLPEALALLDGARELGARMSPGIALLDRARVLMESGLVTEADRTLADAVVAFTADGRGQELAETILERAQCAVIVGDLRAARAYAGRARDRFRRRGNDPWRRSAELVLVQADLAAGRPGARLLGPAERLRHEFEAEGLRLPARTATLLAAEAGLAAGDPARVAATLAGLPRLRPHDPVTSRLHQRYVEAGFARARGDVRSARVQVRRGLDDLARHQARFGSIDLRTAAAVHGRRLAGLDVELALAAGPAAVFAAAERARAVSSRLPPVHPPADAHAAELLAELRQTVEALRAVGPDPAAGAPLQRRRRELERAITALRWTLAGAGPARPPARVAQVRDRLGVASMVTYVVANDVLHAVVVGPGRLRRYELGGLAPIAELIRRARADLDVLANPLLPAALVSAVGASFARTTAALDDRLVRPLGVTGRLVLVTTGALGQLPWSSLPSLREVPVVVAPSASAWLAASARATPDGPVPADPAVVAIAGPDLDRAGDEIAAVGASFPGATLLTGAAGTRAGLVEALTSADLVHLAAHGVHQTENPMFSSIRLADGVLFAHELDGAARPARQVILSACELGLATVRPGDEALGLTSVLLQLGAASVVAGVARVGDDVAAETMAVYHRHLAAGHDPAAALATAIAAAPRPAPFVCFGAV
jgi:tetratricopeptide (TPR) repeat protein